MTIRDAIQSWPHLTWGGSFAGGDTLSVDAATAIIKDVQIVQNKSGKKSIRITVQKADGNSALAVVPPEQISPSESDLSNRVLENLKSAIGKTLDQAGAASISNEAI